MDEGRKQTLGIAAAIIASRRLAQLDFKPSPTYDGTIANAIHAAERIMRKVGSNRPARDHERDFLVLGNDRWTLSALS